MSTGIKLTPIRKRFVKNLKKARESRGFTQEELAERLGITVRYVQRLESKKCPNIGLDAIMKLAKALSVTPSSLIED